jgi:hypothetical protein
VKLVTNGSQEGGKDIWLWSQLVRDFPSMARGGEGYKQVCQNSNPAVRSVGTSPIHDKWVVDLRCTLTQGVT